MPNSIAAACGGSTALARSLAHRIVAGGAALDVDVLVFQFLRPPMNHTSIEQAFDWASSNACSSWSVRRHHYSNLL